MQYLRCLLCTSYSSKNRSPRWASSPICQICPRSLVSPFIQTCNFHHTSLLLLVKRMHVPGLNTTALFIFFKLLVWSKRSLSTLFHSSNTLAQYGRHVTLPPYLNLNQCRNAVSSAFLASDIPVTTTVSSHLVWLGLELKRLRADLVYVLTQTTPRRSCLCLNSNDSAQILYMFIKSCSVWLRQTQTHCLLFPRVHLNADKIIVYVPQCIALTLIFYLSFARPNQIINSWNGLPSNINISSLSICKLTLKQADLSNFLILNP